MITHLTDTVVFFQRTFPSANMTLIRGQNPILIDTGFGSDFPETARLLTEAGVSPAELSLVVNTHYHSDHVGGNYCLQTDYGKPIAATHSEATLINNRDALTCSAEWLRQPIEPYTVDRMLRAGDKLSAGTTMLDVLHTPGHTLGHLSFYVPDEQLLILGDVVHDNDVSWINNFREGAGALERMMETLENLLSVPATIAVSGHGPVHQHPQKAMRRALRRYERWRKSPESVAWHAMKRIYSYALMLMDGQASDEVPSYLCESPWFIDYARSYFESSAQDFVQPFVDEMLRSGAAGWVDGKLMALTAYNQVPDEWYPARTMPRRW
jgi:hydroxyacylglutathione hydrolase